MLCENYIRRIKIGLSKNDKEKIYNQLKEKMDSRLDDQDKVISQFVEWEKKGNWVPKYTTSDENSAVINSEKNKISTIVYKGAYNAVDKTVLSSAQLTSEGIKLEKGKSSVTLKESVIDIKSDYIKFNGKALLEDASITEDEIDDIIKKIEQGE